MKCAMNPFLLRKLHPIFKVLYHLKEDYRIALMKFFDDKGLCTCYICTEGACRCYEGTFFRCEPCVDVEKFLKKHFPKKTRRSRRIAIRNGKYLFPEDSTLDVWDRNR
jgi:hypothetical protein